MSFAEQPPSTKWAALKFKGERIADVWFKPDGEPWTVLFRVPPSSFQLPDIGARLTAEGFVNALSMSGDEVESCNQELTTPLQPTADGSYLEIRVTLKPPNQEEEHTAAAELQILEVRWKTMLGLEATVDTIRNNVESARANLESSMRRSLSADEKSYALAADLAQWNKAKQRAHYAIPKANEFIHRATWASGTPERKRLGEIFKNYFENHVPIDQPDEIGQQLDFLRKDWQVLSATGTAVSQECRGIMSDVDAALRTLQSNAKSRAAQKKNNINAKK